MYVQSARERNPAFCSHIAKQLSYFTCMYVHYVLEAFTSKRASSKNTTTEAIIMICSISEQLPVALRLYTNYDILQIQTPGSLICAFQSSPLEAHIYELTGATSF